MATSALHRSEEPGTPADLPDPVYSPGGQDTGQQTLELGADPMLHRSYAVRFRAEPDGTPSASRSSPGLGPATG